jgi:hypothetical protein
LHPVALAALVLLVLNDHWGKAAFPGFLTGKLSDVAGLAFFPLFLQGLLEVWRARGGRAWAPSSRVLWGAALATALVFSAVKLWTPATSLYTHGLGLLQWPLRVLLALVEGHRVPTVPLPVLCVQDATDLLALPAVLLGVAAGLRRTRETSVQPVPAPAATRG